MKFQVTQQKKPYYFTPSMFIRLLHAKIMKKYPKPIHAQKHLSYFQAFNNITHSTISATNYNC